MEMGIGYLVLEIRYGEVEMRKAECGVRKGGRIETEKIRRLEGEKD